MLEGALASGLASEGIDVSLLGVVPTPEVAWRSATDGTPGAVISASHNPYGDNGIKFFAADGRKLEDAVEERLEAELDAILHDQSQPRAATGRVRSAPDEASGASACWRSAAGSP